MPEIWSAETTPVYSSREPYSIDRERSVPSRLKLIRASAATIIVRQRMALAGAYAGGTEHEVRWEADSTVSFFRSAGLSLGAATGIFTDLAAPGDILVHNGQLQEMPRAVLAGPWPATQGLSKHVGLYWRAATVGDYEAMTKAVEHYQDGLRLYRLRDTPPPRVVTVQLTATGWSPVE